MHEIRWSNCSEGFEVMSLTNNCCIGIWREKSGTNKLVKTSIMGDLYWVKIIGESRDKYHVKLAHSRGSFWVNKDNVIR